MFYIYANGVSIYDPTKEDMQLISPKLVLELGKAGSLEFGVPPTNSYYNQFQQLVTNITVEIDETEIFRGRVLTNNKDFNNIRQLYIEGDLAYLVDSVQKGERYVGGTHALFRKIIEEHNRRVDAWKRFTPGIINIEDREVIIAGSSDDTENLETGEIDYNQIVLNSTADEWANSFDHIENCLIDTCGGYLQTRRVGETVYVDLVTDYGNQAAQEIEFGKNILDLTEEISAEDLFTVLIPLGDDNLTIESVNGGSDELVNEAAARTYGRIIRTKVFSGVNQASTLLENGRRYLESNGTIPTTFQVKAVDMHFVDPKVKFIQVGERVHVNSLPHDVLDYFTCTKIEYNMSDASNTVYTFGNPKQALTERYRKDKRQEKESDRTRGGGGAAAKKAEERADDGLQDFFDAWINVDPEAGHISLGALYKDYEKTVLVLENQVGIDMDAETGNVNIKSLRQEFDETGKVVAEQGAQINLLQKDTEARIEMLVARDADLAKTEDEHHAEFVMFANDTESAIEMKADRVTVEAIQVQLQAIDQTILKTNDVLTKQCGINLDAKSGNINILTLNSRVDKAEKNIQSNSTSITSLSDSVHAEIALVSKSVSANSTKIAAIEVKANNNASAINLKADKVNVDASIISLRGRIESLEANYARIGEIAASYIKSIRLVCSELVVNNNAYVGGSSVTTSKYLENRIKGYATQYWVNNQKFATQTWVTNNFRKK